MIFKKVFYFISTGWLCRQDESGEWEVYHKSNGEFLYKEISKNNKIPVERFDCFPKNTRPSGSLKNEALILIRDKEKPLVILKELENNYSKKLLKQGLSKLVSFFSSAISAISVVSAVCFLYKKSQLHPHMATGNGQTETDGQREDILGQQDSTVYRTVAGNGQTGTGRQREVEMEQEINTVFSSIQERAEKTKDLANKIRLILSEDNMECEDKIKSYNGVKKYLEESMNLVKKLKLFLSSNRMEYEDKIKSMGGIKKDLEEIMRFFIDEQSLNYDEKNNITNMIEYLEEIIKYCETSKVSSEMITTTDTNQGSNAGDSLAQDIASFTNEAFNEISSTITITDTDQYNTGYTFLQDTTSFTNQ